MTAAEQKKAAKAFAEYWKGKGYEKGQSQQFWMSLLTNVLSVTNAEQFITFEEQVKLDHTSFIDVLIPSTHVMIEQKGIDKDLHKGIKQSDGSVLNPFQQAKRYAAELPYSKRPRWIITCNFKEFLVYDMESPNAEPESILLENLEKEYYRLSFIVDSGSEHLKREMDISIKAGEIVGVLYDEILKQYNNPSSEKSLKSLNMLCVRLVFCLYAEDAGIFGRKSMFHDYLAQYFAKDLRKELIELFRVLDTKIEERDPYLDDDLAAFPYVNGGLFADENIEIPQFTERIRELLLSKASDDFDWSEISPTIFGAVFESTLNPETRRSGGMHYTSIENIHKVIDPLFLDKLRDELDEIKAIKTPKLQRQKIDAFRQKLSELTFLDPACGSGNFLTETYISLRRLENEALFVITKGQIMLDMKDIIKVSIGQFYGIEINDFAVTVAKTALWIAESQMMKETETIINFSLDFLPLKSYANITEGNALRVDWESVVPKDKLNYIMGNPPFVGARLMSESQKKDVLDIFGDKWKNAGNLDYVCCWYKKAVDLMKGTTVRAALVSTNSVSQGDSVATLWQPLFKQFGLHIDYAYRTFRWDSEASLKAHVHCVIIGFSVTDNKSERTIFTVQEVKDENGKKDIVIRKQIVENINAYLLDAVNVFIIGSKRSICDVPQIAFGNMPNDSGLLSDYSDEQKQEIVSKYPKAEPLFKKFLGATEFLHNRNRWCLWLKGLSPDKYNKIPPIMNAISDVKRFRENSSRAATQVLSLSPMLFGEIRQPDSEYILIPAHSSENRRYIPIGYVDSDVICGNANLLISNASLYHFGVLTSNIHNAWMRVICGRIKSDYRYSANIVYNNFPWCDPTDEQKAKIEQTAQGILDARALYPDSSLADLYDELTMPPELRKAHQVNDKAVWEAYGKAWDIKSESDCVAWLMERYRELTEGK